MKTKKNRSSVDAPHEVTIINLLKVDFIGIK